MRAVYTDPHQGLLSVSNPTHQILCLECSTTEIGTAADVRNQVSASGIGSVIDCPVSGGIASAAQGDLSIMVGGSQEQYALALPVLEMIGKPANIFHCGPIGHGMATKLINNYCNFLNYATLCEGKCCLCSRFSKTDRGCRVDMGFLPSDECRRPVRVGPQTASWYVCPLFPSSSSCRVAYFELR